jgi:branched-chain amino acid transport system substrate-binding protein
MKWKLALISKTVFIIMFILSGCGASKGTDQGSSASPAAQATAGADKKDAGKSDNTPYKIGAILSLTGPAGWLGQNTQKSIKVLEKQINDSGGVNGHPLQIIYYDDGTKPEESSKGAKKLISEDKVSLLLGPNGTPTSIAAEQVATAMKVPMISMSGGYIPDPAKGWGWAICHSTDQAVERMFQYFKEKNLTKIGVINPNDALGQIADAAIATYSKKYNIEVVAKESFNLKDINMQPQLNSIKSKNPQNVIAFVTGEPLVTIRKQMTEVGLNVPMFAPHSSATTDFIKLIGNVQDGLVMAAGGKITAFKDIPDNDPQKKVMAAYIENFKAMHKYEPGYIEALGYDALNIAVHALTKAGTDGEKIKKYLEEGNEEIIGVNGVFKYTKTDRIGLSPETLRIVEIKNGSWTLIK